MNTVVYYPHIWPQLEWLKVAALCWDKVYVLGPRAHHRGWDPPRPLPEIEIFVDALPGFVDTEIGVGDIVDDNLVAEFQDWVRSRKQQLKERITDERQPLFRVYDKKFSRPVPTAESLLDWLVSEGLAKIKEPKNLRKYGYDPKSGYFTSEVGASNLVRDTKVYLPKEIALHYLALAAAKAARDGNRDLAADQEAFTDVVFHSARTARSFVASSILETYLPDALDQLEVRKIVDIRHELSAKRLEFQAAIQQLVDDFLAVSSEGQLDNVQQSILDLGRERVERTKEIYRRANMTTAVKGLGVTLTPPAVLTSVASALNIGIVGPASIAAALSLFGVGALLENANARAQKTESPWSYILDVSRTMNRPTRWRMPWRKL